MKRRSSISTTIRLDPKCVEAYTNRGTTWFNTQEYNKAIADFTVAIAITPESATHYIRGLCWQNRNDHAKALADYNEAVRLDPAYADATYAEVLALSSEHPRSENARYSAARSARHSRRDCILQTR